MRHNTNIILLGLIISIFSGISAIAENYEFKIGQFDKIRVLDNVNVVYRCLPDSGGYIQYNGAKEFADAFIFNCKDNGTLKIQVNTEMLNRSDLPVIYAYSDYLISAENSSNLSLTIENPAPSAEFKLTQVGNGSINADGVMATKVLASLNTGNGSVNVAGECKEAVFRMVGTGLISADRLKADKVDCKILGTGSIGCWPLQTLTVKGLGSTKIYYKGNPDIHKSGGGKLYALPASESEIGSSNSPERDSGTLDNSGVSVKIKEQRYEEPRQEESEDEGEEYKTVVTLEDD